MVRGLSGKLTLTQSEEGIADATKDQFAGLLFGATREKPLHTETSCRQQVRSKSKLRE